MAKPPLQANITAEKTFSVVCPHCQSSKLCQLSDLPPKHPNPYYYVCTCGKPSLVLLNYRRNPRKPVKLVGTITVPFDPKKIERICEILDISEQGMRVVTDFFKDVSPGQRLNARVMLDDRRRSKLDLPCIVRNTRQDNLRLTIGVQFDEMDESKQRGVEFYMMSVELEIQQ